jgi:hypothetical protein
MSTWLLIFCLALMATIVIHGMRQHRAAERSPQLSAGADKTPEAMSSARSDKSAAPKANSSQTRPSLYASDEEAAYALALLQNSEPRIEQKVFENTCWAEVLVTLLDASAKYDPTIGVYHVFGEDGALHYSVSAPGSIGKLPCPYDREEHKEAISEVLLLQSSS